MVNMISELKKNQKLEDELGKFKQEFQSVNESASQKLIALSKSLSSLEKQIGKTLDNKWHEIDDAISRTFESLDLENFRQEVRVLADSVKSVEVKVETAIEAKLLDVNKAVADSLNSQDMEPK